METYIYMYVYIHMYICICIPPQEYIGIMWGISERLYSDSQGCIMIGIPPMESQMEKNMEHEMGTTI